jgi:O-antigen/teichoic acid export membrane protein
MSRSIRAANGFLTSVLQYMAQIAVQALLAPLVLKVAGRETLGAYAAITQVVALIGLVDIAHSWSLERFLAQSISKDDGGLRFRNVFTTARTMSLLSNMVFSLLVLCFTTLVGRLFHLSPPIALQARHALYVIAVWSVVRTPLAAYNNALVATQELASANIIGASLAVARAVVSLGFVLAGFGLFGLILSGTVVEGCGMILYRMRFRRLNPKLTPSWGVPDRSLFREMFGFGAHAMFLNVGNMLMFTSGNALAGWIGGAASASTFYTTQMPASTGYNVISRLSDNATPAINDLWGRREIGSFRNALVRVLRLTLMMTLPLSTGVLLFNHDLVVAWVGPKQYAGRLLTCALAAFVTIVSLQRIAMIYAFVIGWVRLLTITAILQGLANVALAIMLARRFGLGGITTALVIVILPQTLLLWRQLGRTLDFSPLAALYGCARTMIVPLAISSAAGYLAGMMLAGHRLWTPLAEIVAFTAVYVPSAYLMVFTPRDRSDVARYWTSFLSAREKPVAAVAEE